MLFSFYKNVNKDFEQSFFKLVREDIEKLKSYSIKIDEQWKELLFPQTVLGHAKESHGLFRGTRGRYRNITIKDVCIAYKGSEFDKNVRKKRWEEIEKLLYVITKIINGELNELKYNGNVLFGIEILNDYKIVDNEAFLKGFVLASKMDNMEWRKRVIKEFKKTFNGNDFTMGYGSCFVVDVERMVENNYKIFDFERMEHDETFIDELSSNNVIVEKGDNILPVFIRFKKGYGTSDNLAMLLAGTLYGRDAMFGVFLNDAIDTYDKYCDNPIQGGYDEYIGTIAEKMYMQKFRKEIVKEEEILAFIYTIAKGNTPTLKLSSSHRRLCQMYEESSMSEFEVMLAYIEGNDYPNITFGFDKIQAKTLFKKFERRLRNFEIMFNI